MILYRGLAGQKMYQDLRTANAALTGVLQSNDLFFISRSGAVENAAIVADTLSGSFLWARRFKRRFHLWKYAGVFPPTSSELIRFKTEYLSALLESDYHVQFPGDVSAMYLNQDTKKKGFFPLEVLDPVLLASRGICPWSLELNNRKVLVVHPQADVILKQSSRLTSLHSRPVLNNMIVSGLVPPETNGLEISFRSSWHNRLSTFKMELDSMLKQSKPDLALVAAGAYGLPICSHLKHRGVSSIYMGGALQVLFGLWGGRWRGNSEYEEIATENWIRVLPHKVKGSRFIEKGAYW